MSDHLRNRAVNKIHEAVEEAIAADMCVADFVREAQESWGVVLYDKARADARAFDKLLSQQSR